MICPDKIKTAVGNVMSVSVDEIMSRKRNKPVALARQICMYYTYKIGNNLVDTGEMFNRHHTSIVHAVRCVTSWREIDWEVKKIIEQVEDSIPELNRVHNIDYQI
jgi:chromosomal replication initiation ATPase DnaA